MKVPTLLQAVKRAMNNAWHKNLPQMGKRSDYSDFAGEIYALHDFYSLPFTPEMLTGDNAIFAGWEFESESYRQKIPFNDDQNHVYIIIPYSGTFDLCVRHWEGKRRRRSFDHEVIKPQTIGDFISDCHRANIPLTFTPYGEKLWRGEG